MVAKAQKTESAEPKGVKKFMDETKDQIEKIWNNTFSQLNARFQEREKDVRDFLNKLELDGKTRFETISKSFREQLNVEELLTKLRSNEFLGQGSKLGEELVEQGLKVGEDAIEKLGLVRRSDLEELTGELDKVAKKIESVRKKANSGPTKKSLEALDKRLKKLEKALTAK